MCNDGSNDSAGLADVVGYSSHHNARVRRFSKRCRDVEVGPFREIGEVCEFASISGLLAGIPVKPPIRGQDTRSSLAGTSFSLTFIA